MNGALTVVGCAKEKRGQSVAAVTSAHQLPNAACYATHNERLALNVLGSLRRYGGCRREGDCDVRLHLLLDDHDDDEGEDQG